ncbi:hypothetical protein GIW50_21740 [Pseudomonas syringae]|uniref:Uncharacterized protein n=1 Tax=Pseudomonas syringae TaxID=317 RepID=A0A9Q3ZZ67_PSESX|nr:hypothetical protein [Pseudomonas syringae]MCF5066266.1 hypothetical protein [Pseudomonas syringae]MCF5076595.1 hypothetical protein [Pseudomonas syringae]MCF5121014.1 hypothetical protein [Pseudomonas syringae]MCF5381826.1 hypothetical protein [Pseudomonas syringae]
MKLPASALLLASALLAPAIAHADDAALTDTLKAFTRCDATFFSSLNTHRDAWQAYAPLKQEKNFSWIAVKNRADRQANSVPISAPPIGGLKLLSYADEATDLGSLGLYYYWGFVVEGTVDEVAQRLAPLLEQPARLQKGDGEYIRSELKVGDRWQAIKPRPGTAPGTRNVERVLLVEPEGKQGTQSRISCSVQGGVDAALLVWLRPDIAPVDYPRTVVEPSINDVAVPANVLQRLDSALLQPKFKTLNYTYQATKSDGSKDTPTTVKFAAAAGGLLNKDEIYSENFHVERLVQADLIQLKSKMNGVGDGQVLQTRDIELNVPTLWAPGQTLTAQLRMANVPGKPTDTPIETSLTCQVGQRFPAQQVFASLTGDAIKLECDQGDYKTSRAFIEDLGVALTLETTSSNMRSVYEYKALNVVR